MVLHLNLDKLSRLTQKFFVFSGVAPRVLLYFCCKQLFSLVQNRGKKCSIPKNLLNVTIKIIYTTQNITLQCFFVIQCHKSCSVF